MTYISLADAKTWIAAHIKSIDRSGWDALSDPDKAIALQEAEDKINSLPLRGKRYEDQYIENGAQIDSNRDGIIQTEEFPRIIDGVTCDWDNGTSKPIVPELVKNAVCHEAVASIQEGARRTLQRQGVQSMSIGGKLSENFRPGAGQESLVSAQARRIMRRYVGAELR